MGKLNLDTGTHDTLECSHTETVSLIVWGTDIKEISRELGLHLITTQLYIKWS